MKYIDRRLRDLRIAQAVRRIPPGARVLDVGCHDGALFRAIGTELVAGVGIDTALDTETRSDRYRLVPGRFPDDLPADVGTFDAVTMLATFEHIPPAEQHRVVEACRRHMEPDGRVIITVPSPVVDPLLDVMVAVRVIDGMSHDEHFGFKPRDLIPLFQSHGFRLAERRHFELGLNQVFVFDRAR
jgi:2-polyprenyl-3-methyl-5-hydroxy-6-metoxy-1,4-benzoquinol methylase